jgi:hypothetical protein
MKKLVIKVAVVLAAVAGLAVAPGTPPSTGDRTHQATAQPPSAASAQSSSAESHTGWGGADASAWRSSVSN